MKSTYQVTMVHPRQIVSKRLKGCKDPRTVTNFAKKYGVPHVWWKPTPNYKVMLVDWPQFRTAWKQNNENWPKVTTTRTSKTTYRSTYKPTYGTKQTRTYHNATWTNSRNPRTKTRSSSTTRNPRLRTQRMTTSYRTHTGNTYSRRRAA